MSEKTVQAVIKLRRGSENEFNRSKLVLQKGEVALVTTSFQGTQIKIGDGVTRFDQLKYDTLGLLAKGFISSSDPSVFNDTSVHPINHDEHLLFLDQNTGFLYYWDPVNNKYQYVRQNEVKLYDTLDGSATDGSVTQRALNVAMNRIQNAARNVQFEMNAAEETLNANLDSLTALQILN